MKRKIRWELLFFDTLVYLVCSLFILVIYPSSINKLTPLQVGLYIVVGWACVTLFRFFFRTYQKIWRYAGPISLLMMIPLFLFR